MSYSASSKTLGNLEQVVFEIQIGPELIGALKIHVYVNLTGVYFDGMSIPSFWLLHSDLQAIAAASRQIKSHGQE